jgi:hypothetical protein
MWRLLWRLSVHLVDASRAPQLAPFVPEAPHHRSKEAGNEQRKDLGRIWVFRKVLKNGQGKRDAHHVAGNQVDGQGRILADPRNLRAWQFPCNRINVLTLPQRESQQIAAHVDPVERFEEVNQLVEAPEPGSELDPKTVQRLQFVKLIPSSPPLVFALTELRGWVPKGAIGTDPEVVLRLLGPEEQAALELGHGLASLENQRQHLVPLATCAYGPGRLIQHPLRNGQVPGLFGLIIRRLAAGCSGGFFRFSFRHGETLAPVFQSGRVSVAAPTRIVVGVGATSKGQLAHRTGLALADKLGVDPVVFPGDHGGFIGQPGEFAQVLQEVLR